MGVPFKNTALMQICEHAGCRLVVIMTEIVRTCTKFLTDTYGAQSGIGIRCIASLDQVGIIVVSWRLVPRPLKQTDPPEGVRIAGSAYLLEDG
jgi:hypothetical protein